MQNIIDDEKLVQQAKDGKFHTFDIYGNELRFSSNEGWEVELSIYEGERKVFRPKELTKIVWEKYDTEMGIYVK